MRIYSFESNKEQKSGRGHGEEIEDLHTFARDLTIDERVSFTARICSYIYSNAIVESLIHFVKVTYCLGIIRLEAYLDSTL